MKARSTAEAAIPRALRSRITKLPADQQQAFAAELVRRPDAILRSLGPLAVAEVATDTAAARADAAFRRFAREWNTSSGPMRQAARDKYQAELDAAKVARDKTIAAIRLTAEDTVRRHAVEAEKVDEARTRRVTETLLSAVTVGPGEVARVLGRIQASGDGRNELRLAVEQVLREKRGTDLLTHEVASLKSLAEVSATLRPPEVVEAEHLLAQLDDLGPAFEMPGPYEHLQQSDAA